MNSNNSPTINNVQQNDSTSIMNNNNTDKKSPSPKLKSSQKTKREKSTDIASDSSSSNSTEWHFEMETGQNIDLSHVSTKKPKRPKSEISKINPSPKTSPQPSPLVESSPSNFPLPLYNTVAGTLPQSQPPPIVNDPINSECITCQRLLPQQQNIQNLQEVVQRLMEQNEQYRIQLEIMRNQQQIFLQQTTIVPTSIITSSNNNTIPTFATSTSIPNMIATSASSSPYTFNDPLNQLLSNLLQPQSQQVWPTNNSQLEISKTNQSREENGNLYK